MVYIYIYITHACTIKSAMDVLMCYVALSSNWPSWKSTQKGTAILKGIYTHTHELNYYSCFSFRYKWCGLLAEFSPVRSDMLRSLAGMLYAKHE